MICKPKQITQNVHIEQTLICARNNKAHVLIVNKGNEPEIIDTNAVNIELESAKNFNVLNIKGKMNRERIKTIIEKLNLGQSNESYVAKSLNFAENTPTFSTLRATNQKH